jgi:hypothetical protein
MKTVLLITFLAVTLTLSAHEHPNTGKRISDEDFANQALTPHTGWNVWSAYAEFNAGTGLNSLTITCLSINYIHFPALNIKRQIQHMTLLTENRDSYRILLSIPKKYLNHVNNT